VIEVLVNVTRDAALRKHYVGVALASSLASIDIDTGALRTISRAPMSVHVRFGGVSFCVNYRMMIQIKEASVSVLRGLGLCERRCP
jgi:hypothetical protein